MNRRSLIQGLVASLGMRLVAREGAYAHDKRTPEAAAQIPPIRWNLRSIDSNGTALVPDDPSRYWVQFLDDGVVYIGADCNSASGRYLSDGDSMTITDIITTLIMCGDDSIDHEFLGAISAVTTFSIRGDGSDQLVLSTSDDGVSVVLSASLVGVIWQWEQFDAGNDTVLTLDSPELYIIEILADGTFNVVADRNTGGGTATVEGNRLELMVTSTKAACAEGSSSGEFLRNLGEVNSFVIQERRLHLALPMDPGIASFRAHVEKPSDVEATPAS